MKTIGSRRLQRMGSAIFAKIEQWKRTASAAGHTLIDLGIGSPDRAPSEKVMTALAEAVRKPHNYCYPTSNGTLALRQAICRWFAHKFGVALDAEREVLVLMGTQDGLAHLALALADEGDVALVPNPGYPIYQANLALAGVEAHLLALRAEQRYLPKFDDIPAEVAARARFLLLNYPGNPLAVQAPAELFAEALRFCEQYDLVFAHDYAYSEMTFGAVERFSALQVPGAKQRTIEFHSFSKSFNMAGCRIGFVVGNEQAIAALGKLKANIDYGVFLAVQEAAVIALEEDMQSNVSVGALYEERSRRFVAALRNFGWQVPDSDATMFVWAPVPEGWTSREFARTLLLETGVAVTPGDAFGTLGEGFVRIALVQEWERLEQAAQRIKTFWEAQRHAIAGE